MAETPLPDVDVSAYYIETMVPVSTVAAPTAPEQKLSAIDAMGLYLLDLMAAHGYRVVSGVEVELMEPTLVPFPEGWVALRLAVSVQEFDVQVGT